MNSVTSIINTGIVKDEFNVFWDALPESLNLAPTDTLVITKQYASDSPEQAQLEKMMQACRLDRTQYTTLQLATDEKIAWHKIKDAVQPNYVLLLGIMPMQLGISAGFQLYVPNRFNDCIFIPSLSLSEMERQPEAKKQLWVSGLKPVFVDNVLQ